MQDKSAEKSDRLKPHQPASLFKGSRSRGMNRELFRSNKVDSTKIKLVPVTYHTHPLVKAELERLAELEQLSLSKVNSNAAEEFVRRKLHQQNEALMYPSLTQWFRTELRKFGDRLVYFLLRTAIASEQARILITEVLKRLLVLQHHMTTLILLLTEEATPTHTQKKEQTESPMQTLETIVDKSYKMARANVFRKTYDAKKMLEEWKNWNEEA